MCRQSFYAPRYVQLRGNQGWKSRTYRPRVIFGRERTLDWRARGSIFADTSELNPQWVGGFLSTRDGNRGTYRDITTRSMCVGPSMDVTDHHALAAAVVRVTRLSSGYVRAWPTCGAQNRGRGWKCARDSQRIMSN